MPVAGGGAIAIWSVTGAFLRRPPSHIGATRQAPVHYKGGCDHRRVWKNIGTLAQKRFAMVAVASRHRKTSRDLFCGISTRNTNPLSVHSQLRRSDVRPVSPAADIQPPSIASC